jgi:hypothetical protein
MIDETPSRAGDCPPPNHSEGSPSPTGDAEGSKRPRKHLLGLPPGYKLDPEARPTVDDLAGIPACFGDDEPTITTAQPYPG